MTKTPASAVSVEQSIKDFLTDPKDRIRLDDYVTSLLKSALPLFSLDAYWSSPAQPAPDTIAQRLKQYEEGTRDLLTAAVLLGRWGQPDQALLIEKIVTRAAEANKQTAGFTAWTSMQWYPLALLMYAAGIAALSARNYAVFAPLFLTRLPSRTSRGEYEHLSVRAADEMTELDAAFKALPEHSKHHVPRSEYFFNYLRAPLDELLFLGDGYERLFDDFEVLSALVYAELTADGRGRVWAAPGRFGYRRASYSAFVKDANAQGESWPLLKAGLFRSSTTRFQEIVKGYSELLSRMNFY